MCGTLDYLAPEMVKSVEHTHLVDNWCVGILCYELLVGKPPFESKTNAETYQRILKAQVEYPSFVGHLARDLVNKVLYFMAINFFSQCVPPQLVVKFKRIITDLRSVFTFF